jgi:chromosome segregation ATPase
MIIRQEDTSPIGDFFHDSGINKIYDALRDEVDEFSVNSDRLCSWIDFLNTKLKQLKNQVKKIEQEQQKKQQINNIIDMVTPDF